MSSEINEYDYLLSIDFEQYLKKLTKKLKGKTVLIYGAGILFQTAYKNFDLSGLNIIGISDRKFDWIHENETFLGYKTYSPFEISKLKPDCILIATKYYIDIIGDIYSLIQYNRHIKIKPLFKKHRHIFLKEIFLNSVKDIFFDKDTLLKREYNPNKRISPGIKRQFNVGYLFLEKLYYQLYY